MINITITNDNESLIKELLPAVIFEPTEDSNSFTFCMKKLDFQAFYKEVQNRGIKPFHVMRWKKAKRASHCGKLSLPLLIIPAEQEAEPLTTA